MNEWREDTCFQISQLPHDRVFELACGTGMLLFRLLDSTQYYYGTDISVKGIEWIKKNLTAEENAKTTLSICDARELDKLAVSGFDLAIINSATQYMGPEKEFTDVIAMLADKVCPNGKIFLGDMKSAALRDLFYRTTELWSGDTSELESKVEKRRKNDYEFYLSSAYLETLKKSVPRIKHIRLLNKYGVQESEMNTFRFNAVLYLDTYSEESFTKLSEGCISEAEAERLLSDTTEDNVALFGLYNKHIDDVRKRIGIRSAECEMPSVYPGALCRFANRYGWKAYASPVSDDLTYFNLFMKREK
jgi:SAM-dependent methyltransferase